jgi:predicted Zn finger-like uncharacterized protein
VAAPEVPDEVALITVCPKCQLPLNVTPADLRVALGQVRCGRCAQVFNALVSLQEEILSASDRASTTSINQVLVISAGDADSANTGRFQAPSPPAPAADDAGRNDAPVDDEPVERDFGADTLTSLDIARLMAAGAAQSTPPPEPDMDLGVELDLGLRMTGTYAAPAAPPQESPAPGPGPEPEPEPGIELPTTDTTATDDARETGSGTEPADAAATPTEATDGAAESGAGGATGSAQDDAQDSGPPDSPQAPAFQPVDIIESDPVNQFELTRAANDPGSGLPQVANDPIIDESEWTVVPQLAAAIHSTTSRAGTSDDSGAVEERESSGIRWLEIEAAPPASAAAAGAAAAGARAMAASAAAATSAVTADGPTPQQAAVLASLGPKPAPAPEARMRQYMTAGAVLLAVLLVAQVVHRHRRELADTVVLRAPLTALYGALGRPIVPDWELAAYDVRQLGVVAEPVAAGTLTVRASIRNQGTREQPAPLLRVTLQDRYGNRIAMRDLAPHEYAGKDGKPGPPARAPSLAPGRRIDAQVALLDPGGSAVGFELDACLRREDGRTACANDSAPTAR